MKAPYWGQLPPSQVSRTNSVKREQDGARRGGNGLSVDTSRARPDRSSVQSQPSGRQNRYSTQTDAHTVSTQSPFASPIASEFRGEGLAPRPPSFPGAADSQYSSNEFSERRRRRESRNRDQAYEEQTTVPPPAAPDVPRSVPVSYKQPFTSAPSSYAGSTRRPDGPVSSTQTHPDNYQRSNRRESYPTEPEDLSRRSSNGKTVIRSEKSVRRDSTRSQPRKGSLIDAEQRRREWAPDRSPLQRLELTLDSITKEEKRARVEEAELLAREAKAGRGGERKPQNSVRFRNRPDAKASESASQSAPRSLSEAGLVRSLSSKQKDQLQRTGTMEKRRPVDLDPQEPGFGDLPAQDEIDVVRGAHREQSTSVPQRGSSIRVKSHIPVAAGNVGGTVPSRSTSNKLRKEPPGDPWYNRRTDAERQYTDVTPRKDSTVRPPGVSTAGPSRRTTLLDRPKSDKDRDLPPPPVESRKVSGDDLDLDLDLELEEELDIKPVKRRTLSKIERLTGQPVPDQILRTQTTTAEHARIVNVDGKKYAIPLDSQAKNVRHENRQGPPGHREHHRLPEFLHHKQDATSGQSVYIPSKRLDEWKKGGTALLSGTLLDLEVQEPADSEKDKAWWEAGQSGPVRRNSTKQRTAEAYDGEYDDTGKTYDVSFDSCAGCYSERRDPGIASSHEEFSASTKKNDNSFLAHLNLFSKSPTTFQTHSLTCPMRGVRVRPEIAPTRFKPPLFLKSGPLLRYCGLRREKPQSRSTRVPEREIWRGSIMIVTQDSDSSYELAPTLRLFLQPTELLPPPPAQVDGETGELAPEYVDPLAGLPKIGRDGRTLFIRPVDHLEEAKDLSQQESDEGLFEMHRSPLDGVGDTISPWLKPHYDGEKAGKYKEVRGFRLHAEYGMTFWRFNVEIELRDKQQRIAYRINRGPTTGFWVPAQGQPMNIMFHSCNGFSHGVDPNLFSGPDPLWRDVLNTHQTQPFHVMLGGGDQIYNDKVMDETTIFREWTEIKDINHKENSPFTPELQKELELFYLDRYAMWFSQGLFGVAVSQIPMINIYDDHDIIDGFGSYPDGYMKSPVMSGLGSVAFKYYMLFQHQSSIDEGEESEPSWLLGTQPGPYISELSRSVFTNLGRSIAFLGLDCRTERMNDEVVSAETYHKVFDRLEKDIIKGETKHLIVLVGVPVAYPRMVWLENILTSRAMEPIKALSRSGLLGKKLLNHLDGGVEVLDDLDDHWTARHHKEERNWLIQELQDLAAEKSVRVTILGGDVHLGAIGQFYSNPKLGIPKDRDHRYMPNVISSAIVNTPPPNTLADVLNKRNKIHHLDLVTDEDMIPIFTHDVTGKSRNNKRLLNRRNWCSIRLYNPELSPPPTPSTEGDQTPPPARGNLLRRLSNRGPSYRPDAAPPLSNAGGFFNRRPSLSRRSSTDPQRPGMLTRTLSLTRKDFIPAGLFRRGSKRTPDDGGINGYGANSDEDIDYSPPERSGLRGGSGGPEDDDSYFPTMAPAAGRATQFPVDKASTSVAGSTPQQGLIRSQFHRTPTGLGQKQRKRGVGDINLEGGLDICLNMEVNQKDPAGITMPYRLLVPALWYEEEEVQEGSASSLASRGVKRWVSFTKGKKRDKESQIPSP